jgi:hypothetical protein
MIFSCRLRSLIAIAILAVIIAAYRSRFTSVSYLRLTEGVQQPFLEKAFFNESWLLAASAADLQKLLIAGEITSVTLIKNVLSQVAKYDRQGPTFRAMIAISPVALTVAECLLVDRERASGNVRGPLHGIPIIVKVSFTIMPKPVYLSL